MIHVNVQIQAKSTPDGDKKDRTDTAMHEHEVGLIFLISSSNQSKQKIFEVPIGYFFNLMW